MDRIKVAKELVAMAKLLTAEGERPEVDQWLVRNGWKETAGIGLYMNHRYPLVGVDTNTGEASVNLFKSEADVFNDEGAFVDYTSNVSKLDKALKKAKVLQDLWIALNKKYKSGYSKHFTPHISFFGDSADNVSFEVYADNFTVVVGKLDDGIRRKMTPSVDGIVRFIEEAQEEIRARG